MQFVGVVSIANAGRTTDTHTAFASFTSVALHCAVVVSTGSVNVCVPRLGGLSADLRPQMPMQYLFWLATMLPTTLALGRLLHLPKPALARSNVIFSVLFVSGAVATFSHVFWLWLAGLAVSLTCHVFMTLHMGRLLMAAYAQSKERFTQLLIVVVSPVSFLVWASFPVLWLLCQLGLVSVATERMIWPITDFQAKVCLGLLLVVGGFRNHSKELEEELALLEQQRHHADRTNEARRQFLRWTLHELRVPLQGGVLALDELLHGFQVGALWEAKAAETGSRTLDAGASTATGSAYLEACETAVASAATISKLLDDFLSLAKIEDGRMDLEPVETSVRAWLAEGTSTFINSLRAKHIQLRVVASERLPAIVHMDGNRLRQVLTNYLSNAIKFSPAGSEVVIRLQLVWQRPVVVLQPPQSALETVDAAQRVGLDCRWFPSAAGSASPCSGAVARARFDATSTSVRRRGSYPGPMSTCSAETPTAVGPECMPSGSSSNSCWWFAFRLLSLLWRTTVCCCPRLSYRCRYCASCIPAAGASIVPSLGPPANGPLKPKFWHRGPPLVSHEAVVDREHQDAGMEAGGPATVDCGPWPAPLSDVDEAGVPREGAVPQMHVAVEDGGVGIAAHELRLLFQPYSQIRAGALQKGNGTGLGLALCKKIVELSGGVVGAASEEGRGSCFWFQVPVQPAGTRANLAVLASVPQVVVPPPSASIDGTHLFASPNRAGPAASASGQSSASGTSLGSSPRRRRP